MKSILVGSSAQVILRERERETRFPDAAPIMTYAMALQELRVMHGGIPQSWHSTAAITRIELASTRKAAQRRACQALNYAVSTGRIKRAAQCETCGNSQSRVEAHHHRGYAAKNRLKVKWLCAFCHRAADLSVNPRQKKSGRAA